MKQFYVYTLAYPDGKVFYVGKGQGDRINQHEMEARTGNNITNPYKVNVIRKIWAGGEEVMKRKIYETDSESDAFEIERETIAFYGRSNLTNLTDGGEGMSEEDAARHSIMMRERNINAKVYPGFTDPFGAEYPNIRNLKAFCEEWGLDYGPMYEVASGKRDHSKGWRVIGKLSWVETEFVSGGRFDAYWMVRKEPTVYDIARQRNFITSR